MKRILFAVTGTVAGLIALLEFKTQGQPMQPAGGLPSATLSSPAAAAPRGTSPSPGQVTTKPTPTPRVAGYIGAPVTTRYGIVQVKIGVTAGRIADASFVQLTAFDNHSQDINAQAGPILLHETLSAQSAHVDTVSGASYTSDGYRQSLQSALDTAHLHP
ncbi:MAG: FMN-binding protein [Jatrophihabitans sp.]